MKMAKSSIEPLAFRKALGAFATGVTIVTTTCYGEKFGVTANSFSSVSLDPPLILWSLAKSSASLSAFAAASNFAVHILGSDQQALSNRFASKGIDKFAELALETGGSDVPLLPGCAARFECRTAYRYEGGDHVILVGEVIKFSHCDKAPLLFHAGRYATAARDGRNASTEGSAAFEAADLTYLLAHAYFQLLGPVRRRAAQAGLSLADHYALSVLIARGASCLDVINDLVGHLGISLDPNDVESLATRGHVSVAQGPSSGPVITLTSSGRALMIELIAAAKAREADAQLHFDEAEMPAFKRLLGRFVQGLEAHGDADRLSRHMDLMAEVARGDANRAAPAN